MRAAEKNYIIECCKEDGKCICQLCGQPIEGTVKFVAKVWPAKRIDDFLAIDDECRQWIGSSAIENFKKQIMAEVASMIPDKWTHKYKRAIKFGMPDIIAPKVNIIFHFEKKQK